MLSNDTVLFRSMYPSVFNMAGPFNFGLGNKGDMLRLFDSQSMLQVSMTYADSAGWPKAADGHGRTLERRNFTGNADDPLNWYAGCMGGSPGTAPGPCTETLVFSEINYHSSPQMEMGDWVEIRNIGTQQQDLSGWILRDKNDSNSYVIPQGTILQPGQNLVVSANRAFFEYWWWAGDILIVGDFPFGLKGSKDVIRLFDPQGKLYYSLAYRSDGFWPSEPDGGGQTLEIQDVNGIVNDGQNWFAGCVGGSPGKEYSTVCVLGVSDAGEQASVSLYPNPFTSEAVLEIRDASFADGEEVVVNIMDALGRQVMKKVAPGSLDNGGAIRIEIARNNLVAGIYFYTVSCEGSRLISGKLVIED